MAEFRVSTPYVNVISSLSLAVFSCHKTVAGCPLVVNLLNLPVTIRTTRSNI